MQKQHMNPTINPTTTQVRTQLPVLREHFGKARQGRARTYARICKSQKEGVRVHADSHVHRTRVKKARQQSSDCHHAESGTVCDCRQVVRVSVRIVAIEEAVGAGALFAVACES